MGVSTLCPTNHAPIHPPCVLVTDGDGSLNAWNSAFSRHPRCGASSSPTGMGVSTIQLARGSAAEGVCVLVTDGDGSLNGHNVHPSAG